MTRRRSDLETLKGLRDSLAAHGFSDAELSELVDPKFGIITGFDDLLEDLESLRRLDLGDTPPATGQTPAKQNRGGAA